VKRLPATLLALLLPGCIFLDGSGESPTGGYAPRIDISFPSDSGSQLVATDDFLRFSASGQDDDSLYLEWDWQLDGEPQALGSSENGEFDTALDVDWSPDRTGQLSELRFAVTDGAYESEVIWSLFFE